MTSSAHLMHQKLLLKRLINTQGQQGIAKGFTLIELMIVVVIVGVLSVIALPHFANQAKKAAATEATQQASAIVKQAAAYTIDQGALGPISADCSLYAGTLPTTTKFTYACSGDDISFVVTAAGKSDDNNTKDVTVSITANLNDGTAQKPVYTGI